MPVAPGTFGAAEGVAVFVLMALLSGYRHSSHAGVIAVWAAANLIVFAAGVAASDRVCRMLNQKDPGRVVIDEVSGQMIALSPVLFTPSWPAVITGFVLFRVFDIWKPYPIRKLEALPGGLGVMADDALAGVYAGLLVWAGHALHLI